MGSKSKSKATTLSTVTQILDANLTNTTFGFLPAVGWKGKSPASVSRRVDLQPDLDLLGGFAFLSFASLDELETHIEHNETNSAAISVNVGQKRKAEGSGKRQGDDSGLFVPPSKKKAATTTKKKPPKQISTLTTATAAKPKHSSPAESSLKSKIDKVSSVGTILDDRELSQSTPIDISASGSEMNAQSSPNVFSEISLLCSETVDLGDDEDIAQEVFKRPEKAVADSTKRPVGDGQLDMSTAQVNESEGAVEGIATSTDPIPKKKKNKKRKNEHCDQTSQTKFRIKKKKKSEPKAQVSERTSNVLLDQLENDEFPDPNEFPGLPLQDVENSQDKDDNGEDEMKTQEKSLSLKPKIENVTCARTAVYQGCSRDSSSKTKLIASESSSGDRLIDLTCNTSSELSQAKMVEKNSLDSCTPHSSDRDDETTSVSVLSDLSDHSSDIEMFTDRCGCFLFNNKIEKVEKEEMEKGEEIVDVDVETVPGKEMRKNFLVVSGIEAGHFSYHPDMTKDGTIDTSIQALPNEIDIFLQCAKMQEGEMIKIINPDDSDELHSHFTQQNGRNPDTTNKKATRSATERKRRHHLGDLFNDMKLEVFTDLVDADLYLSKQSILSKGISAIENLEKESKELNNTKKQLMKTNKMLKEKRNLLMFGKESIDVDSAKVEAIFRHLNIQVDDEEPSKTEENSNSGQDVAVDVPSELKLAVEPSVKGRPRAKKTLLSPWVSNNKPSLKSKDDQNIPGASLVKKASTPSLLETSKEILGTTTVSSSLTLPSSNMSNVSCGVQTQEVGNNSLKSVTSGNPPLSQSLPPASGTEKSKPLNESASQEGPKANLVKILPKPNILYLNPTQHKAFMDTLGQVKQPSSDKIICNLSRLSTTQNPGSPSSICIIRSGQLMKSLDSKNVMHLKITNDALKNVDSGSGSTSSMAPASSSNQQVLNTTATARVPGFVTLGVAKMPEAPGTSSGQTPPKHPENTLLVSQIPLKSTTTTTSSTAKLIFAGKPLGTLASTSTTEMPQSTSQTSSDITLRALASLSQLQANRPPLAGTVTKPLGLSENPVAGILSGLKNVVMKVVPRQPEAQSTAAVSVLPTLPTATITTTLTGATSSHISVPSLQEKSPPQPRKFSLIPIISVPSSSPLNSSFTASALNQPFSSSGINAKVDTGTPLIKTCLDPFNLVPRELAASTPPISLEPDLPSASVDLETDIKNQLDNLTSSESPSPFSDDIFKEEPSTSSTVLTQEMLKIPGIEQRPDIPLAKLPEVFENLADLDKTTDAVQSPEPSCGVEERKPEGADTCNFSKLSHGSEVQTDIASLSLRSSTIGAKKSTSPLKVEIKDFRKGEPFQTDMERLVCTSPHNFNMIIKHSTS